MSLRKFCTVVAAGAVLLCTARTSLSQTLTLPLEPPPGIMCGDSWVESGVTLTLNPATGCNLFFLMGFNLVGNMVSVDLTGVPGPILFVELDVIDSGLASLTFMELLEGVTVVDSDVTMNPMPEPETLVVLAGSANPDKVVFLSGATFAIGVEMRIHYEPSVPLEETTWGSVKAVFLR